MNHSEPTSAPPRGVGRVLPGLTLLLLPWLVVDSARSRQLASAERSLLVQTPYLAAIGAPSMRFLDPAPPPDLVTRPPAAAPPLLKTEAPTRPDVIPASPEVAATSPTNTAAAPEPAATATTTSTEEHPTPRPVAPILVDELRPRVRAEDFLPYFQIPAEHNGDVSVLVPIPRGASAPAALPTSSATYTQSPR